MNLYEYQRSRSFIDLGPWSKVTQIQLLADFVASNVTWTDNLLCLVLFGRSNTSKRYYQNQEVPNNMSEK